MAKGLPDYGLIAAQIEALAEEDAAWVPLLANASALVMDGVDNLNWAGFYLMRPVRAGAAGNVERELVLGPFQGKVACVAHCRGARRVRNGRCDGLDTTGARRARICRAHRVRQRVELRGGGADPRGRARRGRAGRGLSAGGKVWRGGRARHGGRGRRHRALLRLREAGVAGRRGCCGRPAPVHIDREFAAGPRTRPSRVRATLHPGTLLPRVCTVARNSGQVSTGRRLGGTRPPPVRGRPANSPLMCTGGTPRRHT